jgi:hypothetical protein
MTTVLTVMSDMNPHIISGTWDLVWLSLGLGLSKWVLLGCGSVTVRLCEAIKAVTLRR